MGVISDSFRARLDEMKARHAETDRRIEELIEHTNELIASIDWHMEEEEEW